MPPRVGRFRLLRPLARGGMGEVWLGRDDTTGLEAALKWMLDLSPKARERFEAEIRAVAAMAHPNLVVVYDVGRVPRGLSLGSSALPAGAPWFAMELLADKPVVQVRDFASVEHVLSSVLKALAHAHARGWVHCDLKPDNVMRDAQGRMVVTDFGVARPLDPVDPIQGVGGTPEFMAPEQLFVQDWRIGPWTDLFAVGLLAWVLCTGASPIPRADVETLRRLHGRPIPLLRSPFPVPRGFADWVDQLLQAQPAWRFRSAADALAALSSLDKPLAPPPQQSWFDEIVAPPWGPGQPMPASWRAEPGQVGSRSGGWERGLGLVRRRELALVGREREQDALWAELAAVIATGRSRVVQVTGEGGIGKTALARWLCARVEELGVARAHRVSLGTGDDVPSALLVRVLGRMVRAAGPGDPPVWPQGPSFTDVLSALRVPASFEVAALLQDPDEVTGSGALSPMKGARSVAGAMVALSEGRPVVVWLDDADRATSALVQIEALKEVQHPVLVVASSREPLLRTPPQLDLRLPPMSPETLSALLQEVVPLDPALAVWIRDRSAGLPLVALSLLGELIDRGGLRWNGVRWASSGADSLPVPESVRELLVQKVQRLVPDALRWVEIAAVLGSQVEIAIWDEVASAMGLPPRPEDLVGRLVDGGILSIDARTAGRLWFNHALVAEALAQQSSVRVALHQAAAQRYEARGGTGFERAADHWVAAEQPERALEAWFQAVRFWSQRDLSVARELAVRTVSRRNVPPALVARLAVQLAGIYRNMGDWHRALDATERGLLRVDAEADPTTAAELHNMRAWCFHTLGGPFAEEEARALALLSRVSDRRARWKVWVGHALRRADERQEDSVVLGYFDKAIEEAPTEALRDEARMLRAGWQCANARLEEAEAELEAVRGRLCLPEDPFHSSSWLWIHGTTLFHQGQRQRGLAERKQSLELRKKLGGMPMSHLLSLATFATRARDVATALWAREQLGPNAADLVPGCLIGAMVAAMQDDLPQACQNLDQLQKLEPKVRAYADSALAALEDLGLEGLREALLRAREKLRT